MRCPAVRNRSGGNLLVLRINWTDQMNIKLLRAVKRAILAEPKRLNMHTCMLHRRGRGAPRCGTVGCIAGWALLIDNRKRGQTFAQVERRLNFGVLGEWHTHFGPLARELLGLTRRQASQLFLLEGWPTSLRRAYDRAPTFQGRAVACAERIDLFIKTEG